MNIVIIGFVNFFIEYIALGIRKYSDVYWKIVVETVVQCLLLYSVCIFYKKPNMAFKSSRFETAEARFLDQILVHSLSLDFRIYPTYIHICTWYSSYQLVIHTHASAYMPI
jgi:hypothetical protein